MPETILILQEQQSELDFAADALKRAGYRVVSVPSLSVAVCWLRVNDPSLIIAPVHLIDDDVFELLRFVRGDFQLKHTKILLYCSMPSPFTSGMSRTISSAARAMGANAVIIGENNRAFDHGAFWQAVGPLLPGVVAPQSTFDSFLTQEQTIPPSEKS